MPLACDWFNPTLGSLIGGCCRPSPATPPSCTAANIWTQGDTFEHKCRPQPSAAHSIWFRSTAEPDLRTSDVDVASSTFADGLFPHICHGTNNFVLSPAGARDGRLECESSCQFWLRSDCCC